MKTGDFSWNALFTEDGIASVELKMLLLRKSGEPFLLLPAQPGLAAKGLFLYPAQTFLARMTRGILSAVMKTRLPIPLEKTVIRYSPDAPLPHFCATLTSTKSAPRFALLAGNPNAAGRRFILLVFNERGDPVSIVKAGLGEIAGGLVRREEDFLAHLPERCAGAPRVSGSFQAQELHAFAMDFFDGVSPRGPVDESIATLLGSWLDSSSLVTVNETGLWKTLESTCAGNPLFVKLTSSLAGHRFHPVLFHGDFAPWNIKVSPGDGSWKIFDWERGELKGIPGWDWFHYLIQQSVLVQRMNTGPLIAKLKHLLVSELFQDYAKKTGIDGLEREFLLLYLLYSTEVLNPSEGMNSLRALLSALSDTPFPMNK